MEKTMRVLLITIISLLMLTNAAHAAMSEDLKARVGEVEGRLMVDSKPIPYAVVSFFKIVNGAAPRQGKVQRVPDMVSTTDNQGYFSVRLLAGTYYIGALARKRGAGLGPPKRDEARYFALNEQGDLRLVKVTARMTENVGTLTAATLLSPADFTSHITIRGTLYDEEARPMAGVFVIVKETMGQVRPSFISSASDSDGKYSLRLPPGGYYLMARENFQGGGRLGAGSYVGVYGYQIPENTEVPFVDQADLGGMPQGNGILRLNSQAKRLVGDHGQVFNNIDIHLFRIPDPVETRKKIEAQSQGRLFEDHDTGGEEARTSNVSEGLKK